MAKNSGKKQHRSKNPVIKQSHGEMLRHLRALGDELNKLHARFENQRRINWMIVHENHGRIEIPADLYSMTLTQGEPGDYIFKIEPSDDKKTVAFIECDEKGEAVSKIIVPGKFGGK